uniref:Retrovirus-related Pol polyprotein from transposon TNT 1-94 n=1 Tax=Cajanus cajan TaxID=3821 RepID=A0A151RMA0_CAJCA|nr:Retrovirus-related Pol polyprotein from transposon TNT 1-94 [Cajanus cajan]
MKTLLGSQSLWDIVEKGYREPEEDEDQSVAQIAALEKTRVKDKSALYFLYNAVDESGFEKIANAASSKEAWKILEVAHRGNHRVRQIRLQTLRGEFESLKMEDKEQVSEYITRVEKVANQLGRNGEPMPASRIVEKILRSLTDDFESIACVIEESKDLSVLSVEELAGSLEAHEQRRRKMKNTLDQALQAQLDLNETRNTQGRRSGGQGRGSQPRSEVECYKCGKLGHYAKECRSANCYNYEKSEAELDLSCLNNSVWYLDTGASNHMCGEESFFNELIKVKAGFVSFGDDSKVAVKGRGTIKFMQKDGRVGEIRNVYYVPELKNNILSMGQMMEKGNSVLMKDRVLYLKDKHDRLIARVEMKKNRMYKLELNILQNKCLKLDVKDEAMMWHFRFGHLNFGGLAELSRKELVLGLRGVEFDKKFCEACVLGKHTRTSFPSSSEHKAKEQLGLIHTDLCGPISPASFSGKKYFISFIDDFSRKTWVYFLQEKSKAFEAFKKFKVMVEKETNKQIKALRSDRGGEFTSAEFMEYCEEQGIKRLLTAPYSPQQNGVAERKNRTILDMVRTMLKGKNMPEKFWAEAVQCAIYIQNRCPHSKLDDVTPQEAWSGQKPSIRHFKIFGSLAYGHVPAQLRTKLDDRSKKYILIGYDEKAKAYKLYNPVTGKILVSRDVQVDEESEWSWSNSEETSGSSNLEIIGRSSEIIGRSSDRTNEHSEEDDEPEQLRTRSLQDIYNSTDELHVVCLLTRTEDIKSEEAVLDERWKKAMDEEIGSIEKSEMGSKAELVEEFKEVKREFVMTDLGIMKYFLGLKVDQRATGIFVSQKRHQPPRRRGCWTLHDSRGHGTRRSIALWWKKHRNERRMRNLRLFGSFVG